MIWHVTGHIEITTFDENNAKQVKQRGISELVEADSGDEAKEAIASAELAQIDLTNLRAAPWTKEDEARASEQSEANSAEAFMKKYAVGSLFDDAGSESE